MESILHLDKICGPIVGRVDLPGSKSLANRALLLAALAHGRSIISGVSDAEDCLVMIQALKLLGVDLEQEAGDISIDGDPSTIGVNEVTLDLGEAGTVLRFLLPALAFTFGAPITLTGRGRLPQRPIKDLLEALESIGAKFEYAAEPYALPLTIHRENQRFKSEISISGSLSSQFISGLIIAAPLLPEGLKISVTDNLVSAGYVDLTRDLMIRFGVHAQKKSLQFLINPSRLVPTNLSIEGDASAATYFWGLGALSRGKITVENLSPESKQPDLKFLDILKAMGADVQTETAEITVSSESVLSAVDADLGLLPDAALTAAVLAACARGTSRLSGLSTLKNKESDRLTAIQAELTRLGIGAAIEQDSLIIRGSSHKPAVIETYGDHRMAMAFSLFCALGPIDIRDPFVVKKSFPTYWETLRGLGVVLS